MIKMKIKDKVDKIEIDVWEKMEMKELQYTVDALVDSVKVLEEKIERLEAATTTTISLN